MNNLKKLIPVIILIAIIGCSGQKQKDAFLAFKESITSVQPGVSNISDVALYLEKSEAEYLPEIPLNTGMIDIYMQQDTLTFMGNDVISSAIMGIYSADIAYHLVFYQRDKAFESFSAAKVIANELGLGDVFVDNFFNSIDFGLHSGVLNFNIF